MPAVGGRELRLLPQPSLVSLGPRSPIAPTALAPQDTLLFASGPRGRGASHLPVRCDHTEFTSDSWAAWRSSLGALLEDLGSTLAHARRGRRKRCQGRGTPRSAAALLPSRTDTPSSRTPHSGAATSPSQLHGGRVGALGGTRPAHPGSRPVPGTGLLVRRTKARRPLQIGGS